MEYITKKKKKKSKNLFNSESALENELINKLECKTKSEVYNKLFKIMKFHVGKENKISNYDLFVKVYGVSPESLDIFKREYLFNVIKAQLKEARRDNSLFTIMSYGSVFVLKSEKERKALHSVINLHIGGLKGLQSKASKWVMEEKWKNIK